MRKRPLWPKNRHRLVRLYARKRDAIPNADVEQMILQHRDSLGIKPRKISDEEIVQRLVFSLVNEAAHILEEGIASKASDIDIVYICGYGFPVYRGGPMNYADELGLFNVVQAMNRFAQNPLDDASFWKPAPLLAQLAAEGKTFNIWLYRFINTAVAAINTGIPMTQAVIVSLARTPLAKKLEGRFNMTHGATLGGHAVQHAIAPQALTPLRWTTSSWVAPLTEGATGTNIARQIALKADWPASACRA